MAQWQRDAAAALPLLSTNNDAMTMLLLLPSNVCSGVAIIAAAVVAVLTPEFVRKRHPMWELGLALERHRQESSDSFVLIPVLQGLTIEDLSNAMKGLYGQQGSWDAYQRPDDATLQSWADMLKAVSRIVCKRDDQVCCCNHPVAPPYHLQ